MSFSQEYLKQIGTEKSFELTDVLNMSNTYVFMHLPVE